MKRGLKDLSPNLLTMVGPFTKIARTMARAHKLEVIPSGLGASTTGKAIYIPFTSDYLPTHLRVVLHGKLDHEVQHVIEETKAREAGVPTPIEMIKSEENKTIRMLFNAYEDIRIERIARRRHPGVAQNLRANNEFSTGQIRKNPAAWGNFWHRLGCAIIMRSMGTDTGFYDEATCAYIAELEDLIVDSLTTTNPVQAMALARETYERVMKTYKGAADHGEDDKKSGEKGSGEGEESEDESGEPGDERGESSSGEDGEGDDDRAADEDESEESKAAAARRKLILSIDPKDGSELDDLDKAGSKALEDEVRADAVRHKRYIPEPACKRLDRFIVPTVTAAGEAQIKAVRTEMSQVTGGLRTRMMMVLQARARRRVVSGLDTGRLEDGLVSEVRTGNRHVFSDVFVGDAVDTAIEHLVDLSGSMHRNEHVGAAAYYALRATVALAEAWHSLRIANEFMGFDNNDARHPGYGYSVDGMYQPRSPFDYYMFKHWDESLPRARGRFSHIFGHHQNADGEAVWTAAQRLAARPEKRKILVVISDGQPCDHGDPAMLAKHLKEVVKTITNSGIEVIGVGAGTDAPRQYYNASTGAENLVVKALPNLPADLFNLMYKKMMKKRRAA